MSDRDIIHAALLWHAANVRRLAVGKEKRRLDEQLRAGGDCAWSVQRRIEQSAAERQLTELKRKELAALRQLAKACEKQRGRLGAADVIDLDGAVALLPNAG
jgi:hypothetical protein